MNAQEFVNLLSSLQVLDSGAVEALRGRPEVAGNTVTAQQILKSLLNSGQLTREQAKAVVAHVQQLESQPAAEDEVVDLSQANLSTPQQDGGEQEDVLDFSQFASESGAGDTEDEVIDLDAFGAEGEESEGSSPEPKDSAEEKYRPEDEEEEVDEEGQEEYDEEKYEEDEEEDEAAELEEDEEEYEEEEDEEELEEDDEEEEVELDPRVAREF